jgi:ribosomal protein S12 methylthiotransferase accessory factor YcaO
VLQVALLSNTRRVGCCCAGRAGKEKTAAPEGAEEDDLEELRERYADADVEANRPWWPQDISAGELALQMAGLAESLGSMGTLGDWAMVRRNVVHSFYVFSPSLDLDLVGRTQYTLCDSAASQGGSPGAQSGCHSGSAGAASIPSRGRR